MKCPICQSDLSPLDLVSRTEHVDICIENGPSVLEIGESGRLVIKKNVPPGKQRKICPICDKTFQNLNSHFKTCAIKNDVPPHLMLDYWDKINHDTKNPKKFPRELLDAFVTRSVKEGRVGDQVDFARALSLSMADSEPRKAALQSSSNSLTTNSVILDTSQDGTTSSIQLQNDSNSGLELSSDVPDVNQVLMRNAITSSSVDLPTFGKQPLRSKPRKQFRIELVDDTIKVANVQLRVEREMAATRYKRYQEAVAAQRQYLGCDDNGDDDDCVIQLPSSPEDSTSNEVELEKLFFRARLKDCNGSESCLQASCEDHQLALMLEEYRAYSGTSMDAAPNRSEPVVSEDKNPQCSGGIQSELPTVSSGEVEGSCIAVDEDQLSPTLSTRIDCSRSVCDEEGLI